MNNKLFIKSKKKKNGKMTLSRRHQTCFFKIMIWVMLLELMLISLNGSQRMDDIYGYLPEDTLGTFTINFHAIAILKEYNELLSIWKEHLAKEIIDDKFETFIKKTEIDLRRDLLKATFVISLDPILSEPQFAIIINANYKLEKVFSALKDGYIDLREYTYNNDLLLNVGYDKKEEIVLGFLNSSHLALGMKNQVQKILDVKGEKIKNIKANEKMKRFWELAKNEYALAMFFFIPDELRVKRYPFQKIPIDFSHIESLIFVLNRRSTIIRLKSSDYEKNKKIASSLSRFKTMVLTVQPTSNIDKCSIDLFNSSLIKAGEAETIITIPTEKFLPFLNKILK